ncbi:aminotransferase class I/II-fold pyridoxal phosphate-dependent enzyme [Chryseomicrobium palamuruense]|uniref:Aminotransferase class I/II-fold pyridoxal phosphate-dependent enzyme n=1 Tax=Chryseomicrobium palamuruense TaxID=682973 RepID=A0ABV8UUV5_9BACL
MRTYLTEEQLTFAKYIEQRIESQHEQAEAIAFYNQQKVLDAFWQHQVSEHHLKPSFGYGYDDEGRDTLENVYATVFGSEAALVRPQIISGTHAITIALFGILRPGDELVYITGKPYDTLASIVDGGEQDTGSLKDFQISYRHIDLTTDNQIDWEEVKHACMTHPKVIAIQRSRGYANRPSFTIAEIKEMIQFVKNHSPETLVFVDNCYGEFVEKLEPTEVGADFMAGSLIKNPGGGLAKIGGYIVGNAAIIEKCAYRMTSPGIGGEAGASLHTLQDMYQGFFMAPHTVMQAVKGAYFTAAALEDKGYRASPSSTEIRTDLIQSVIFEEAEPMITFCQKIQSSSPINAQFAPIPAYMPGYEDDVIMAAGTFIQGSSIELTADGPLRPPYIAFVQGGLTYEHVKTAILRSLFSI